MLGFDGYEHIDWRTIKSTLTSRIVSCILTHLDMYFFLISHFISMLAFAPTSALSLAALYTIPTYTFFPGILGSYHREHFNIATYRDGVSLC